MILLKNFSVSKIDSETHLQNTFTKIKIACTRSRSEIFRLTFFFFFF